MNFCLQSEFLSLVLLEWFLVRNEGFLFFFFVVVNLAAGILLSKMNWRSCEDHNHTHNDLYMVMYDDSKQSVFVKTVSCFLHELT